MLLLYNFAIIISHAFCQCINVVFIAIIERPPFISPSWLGYIGPVPTLSILLSILISQTSTHEFKESSIKYWQNVYLASTSTSNRVLEPNPESMIFSDVSPTW